MKVRIKNYPTWLGPYQLVEKIFFWARKEDEHGISSEADWVYSIGDWLAHTWFGNWWSKIANKWLSFHHKHRVKVRIDPWDTWSMDDTLAHIILPMLKQLKETKHGAPYVDPKDVPKELQPKKQTKKQKDNGETDSTHFERWDWVLDEMIFAFETKVDDGRWEEQFESGTSDIQWKTLENGMSEMVRGPNDTKEYDWEGRKKYQERISNGFRLFGKYYENLWD